MNSRALADRQANLVQRSRGQRNEVAQQLAAIHETARGIDRGIAVADRWLTSPVAIGVTLTAVLLLARHRPAQTLGAGLGLVTTAMRVRGVLARFGSGRE